MGRSGLLLLRLRKLFASATTPSWWPALRRGVAASIEHAGVPFPLQAATVVDIGANRGQFALFASRRFPGAHLVCFEPLKAPFSLLNAILGGRSGVELHNVAVGPRRGQATMSLASRDDSSSLLPLAASQTTHMGLTTAGQEDVQVGPLSDFLDVSTLPAPRLLKLDVQGYELECLRACEDQLSRFDMIYVECSFVEMYTGQALAGEITAWLQQRQFGLAGVFNQDTHPLAGPIQADFLFLNRERPA